MSVFSTNGSTEDAYCHTLAIQKSATTLIVGVATDDPDDDTKEGHALLFFDTSSIPDDAEILGVKLKFTVVSLKGNSSVLILVAYMGADLIGSTSETTDYNVVINNGRLLGNVNSSVGAKTIQAPQIYPFPTDYISKTGWTNVEIDAYWNGSPGATGMYASIAAQEHTTASYRPVLEVTYKMNYAESINESVVVTEEFTNQGRKLLSGLIRSNDTIIRKTGVVMSNTMMIADIAQRLTTRVVVNTVKILDAILYHVRYFKPLSDIMNIIESRVHSVQKVIQNNISITSTINRFVVRVLITIINIIDAILPHKIVLKVYSDVMDVKDSIKRLPRKVLSSSVRITQRIRTTFNGIVTALWSKISKDTNGNDWTKTPKDL